MDVGELQAWWELQCGGVMVWGSCGLWELRCVGATMCGSDGVWEL